MISMLGFPNRFAGLLLLLALSLLALVQARPANAQAATFPIIQDFRSTTAPGWLLSGTAELTANADGAGNGWLRLTNDSANQAGAAIYNTAFPSTDGIVVRFTYATYGGSGADGFSFFLLDGSTTNPQPGARGGALGYSKIQSISAAGLPNGYVGIGFDEYGNFSNDSALGTPPGTTPYTPNSIALRGSGNGLTGYRYLTGQEVGLGIDTGSRDYARPVEVVILGGKITVKVDYGDGSGYVTEINEYDLNTATGQAAQPATFKLGFSGSTGGQTNFHEIRDASIRKPGDLSIAMNADKTVAASGDPVVLTVVVRNDNTNTANGVSVLSASPGLTYGAWTCTASAGSTCPASGSGNPNASVNLDRNGTATFTINTTFAPSAGAASVQATAQLNTDLSDISDINSANNQANVLINNTFYSVSATVSGGNGTVSCTPTTVTPGGSSTCTTVPASGLVVFQVQSWTGACASAGSNAQCTLSNIQSNQTSTVSFVPLSPTTNTVSATVSGGNGTVSCTPTTVTAGGSSSCTATPNTGFQVQSWSGACASAGSNAQCTLSNIRSNQSSTVSFVAIPPTRFSVSALSSSSNGTVSCTPASVIAGGKSSCTAVPNPGFQVQSWSGAGASAGANTHCTLKNIQANQVSGVNFSALPPASYHVSASVVGGNGSVSCNPTTVTKGGNSTCTAVPDVGYQVQSWGGACASWGSDSQCYLPKIRADQTSTVTFAPIPPATYNVSATVVGGNGSVSCSPDSVQAGGTSTCTAVPDAGYQVQSWTGACQSTSITAQCTLTNIQADQDSTVSFAALPAPTFTISATVTSGNGAVSCAPSPVPQGDSSSCTATPDAGYQIAAWTGACAASSQNADCALSNIQANQSSTVSFTAIPPATYHVSARVVLGHGSVSCTPNIVTAGGDSACTAVPEAGYQVANWTGACAAAGSNAHCALTQIKADQDSTVSFAQLPPATYTVSATVSGGNGTVSCTPNTVTAGGSSSCAALPDAGYAVQSWTGACAASGSNTQCTLSNLQANQSSTVRFAAQSVPTFTISATVSGGNGTVSCSPSPVPQGDSSGCTAVPNSGYQIAAWTGACAATGHIAHCALSNVQSNQTSTVSFEVIPVNSYSVTASVDLGQGAVSCTPGTVTAGGSSTCIAVPEAGYQVQAWSGNCAASGSQAQCHLTNIRANQTSTVRFARILPETHNVSATVSGGNGTVSCTPSTVDKFTASTCTAIPATGYRVDRWTGACAGTIPPNPQCYLTKIRKDAVSTVSFAAIPPNTFIVTATVSSGNGAVSCTPTSVPGGGNSACTAASDPGYQVAHWDGACLLAGANPQCTLPNLQSDAHTSVTFTAIPPTIFSVSATVSGGNGTVSCTPDAVTAGSGSSCTALPSAGYQVQSWTGACASAGSNAQCSLSNIQANQTSTVSFRPMQSTAVLAFGVFRPQDDEQRGEGLWFLDANANDQWDQCGADACHQFGKNGDRPVIGPWDSGAKRSDFGVFRAVPAGWFLDYNGDRSFNSCDIDLCYNDFGQAGDWPIVGDWNSDGRIEIGVFREGNWYFDHNGNGRWEGCAIDQCFLKEAADPDAGFGLPGDLPFVGDWNSDGRPEIGTFRDGNWYFDANGNGRWDGCAVDQCFLKEDVDPNAGFGLPGDLPVVGDWNSDGRTEIGTFRNGDWFLDNGNGRWDGCAIDRCALKTTAPPESGFGLPGDLPVIGRW